MSRFARLMDCDDLRDLRLKLARASRVGHRFLGSTDAGLALPRADPGGHRNQPASPPRRARRGTPGSRRRPAGRRATPPRLRHGRLLHAVLDGGAVPPGTAGLSGLQLSRPGADAHGRLDLQEGDVLIVLSLTGALPGMPDILRLARAYGARILALTRADGPLARWRTWCSGCTSMKPTSSTNRRLPATGCCWSSTSLATELALRNVDASQEPAPGEAGAGRIPPGRRPTTTGD